MFIAIIGTKHSGKSSVEDYLVSRNGFISLKLDLSPIGSNNNSLKSRNSDISHMSPSPPKAFEISNPAPSSDIPVDRNNIYQDENTSSFFLDAKISTPIDITSPKQHTLHHQINQPIHFISSLKMLDHATRNWRLNFVTTSITSYDTLQEFSVRPFFLLISLDGPILERYSRFNNISSQSMSLEQFIREHDQEVYGNAASNESSENSSLQRLDKLATLHINNSFHSLTAFHDYLDSLNIMNPERLRPEWDTYFMHLASLASRRSNCMKRRVGAILVRNNRILATGYNGTARGLKNCNEGGCPRCNTGGPAGQDLGECICLHAEENALLESGRERIGEGTILYCNTCPCLRCCVKIIQSGVREVVYHLQYKVDEASAKLFAKAGVVLRRHAPQS